MHECPECGQMCDCDGEDIFWDWDTEPAEECTHACDPYNEEDSLCEEALS